MALSAIRSDEVNFRVFYNRVIFRKLICSFIPILNEANEMKRNWTIDASY